MTRILLISLFFITFSFSSALAQGQKADDTYTDASCDRLDVKRLNVSPSQLVDQDVLDYIDEFIRGWCHSNSSANSLERLVDLAYLNERLETVATSAVFNMPNYERMDKLRGQLQSELKKAKNSPKQTMEFSAHDAAVAMFLSCQRSAFSNLSGCENVIFDRMKVYTETLSPEQWTLMTSPLLETAERRRKVKRRFNID